MAAMADETSTPSPQGGRPGGNREPGGFRIRLSDNEMRAARAVQEAFRLRSTVAVLGFCLRTVAQLLEEGKLDELVNEARSQAPRDSGRGGRRGGTEGRGSDPRGGRAERAPRIDPFARPSRPKPTPAAPDVPTASAEGEEVTAVEPEQAAGADANVLTPEAGVPAEDESTTPQEV
jgi:hypothetical protein